MKQMKAIQFVLAVALISLSITSCKEKPKTEPAPVQKADISEPLMFRVVESAGLKFARKRITSMPIFSGLAEAFYLSPMFILIMITS